MKKIFALSTTLLLTFILTSCHTNGGMIKFSANNISHNAIKEDKILNTQGHTFIYYNVYSDNDGNFIMKDNSSYILNNDIQFGLKVKTPFVYELNDDGNEKLIKYDYFDDEGYYNYAIVNPGIVIYGIAREVSLNYENINIGYIFHRC